METPTSTALITEWIHIHADKALMNIERFYDPSMNAGKGNKEETPPSPIHVRSPAASAFSEHVEIKKFEKKKEASHSLGSSYNSFSLRKYSSEDHKVDCYNKGVKGFNVLQPVNTHLTNALNINNYHLYMQSQKYDGRFAGKIAKAASEIDTQTRIANLNPLILSVYCPSST